MYTGADRATITPQGGGGGGYSDIFIHTWARAIFGVQNFEFQYYFVVFRKIDILGYEEIVNIFGGYHKIGLYLGVIPMHVWVFS